MAILKRILCKGEEDGKRCRKWKQLNEDGYCDKCSNIAHDDEEPCGMCPTVSSATPTDAEANSPDPGMKIQCVLCDEWFHAACIGSKEYVEYIGREAPTGPEHDAKGGIAIDMWFCASCVSKKAIVFKDIKAVLKFNFNEFTTVEKGKAVKKQPAKAISLNTQTAPSPTQSGTNEQTVIQETRASTRQDMIDQNTNKEASIPKTMDSDITICSFYKVGKCRHGSSGRKVINGRQCNFAHPRKCTKFCKFGRDKF